MTVTSLANHPIVKKLAQALDNQSAGVFVVGGSVRDALLGQPVKDLDLVVTRLPLDKLESQLRTLGPVDLVGKRFAVLKLVLNDAVVDVALPRTDASFGTGKYRDVEVRADPNLPIERDLERRDFTMNAMAWDVRKKRLIDPHGGQTDLKQKTIRCVGHPAQRFQEDATRMLRAVRFAVQLGFSLELKTGQAIKEKLPLLEDANVAPREVVAKELLRAFGADPVQTLDLLHELGIIAALIPELAAMRGCEQPPKFHAEGDVWTHTRIALEALKDPAFQQKFDVQPSTQLVLAVLLHDIGKPPTQRTPERDGVDRIRFDNHAQVGASMTKDICQRLRLDSTGELDCELLSWAILHHLDTLNLDSMKLSTIEKTFMLPPERGELLQQLCWADARASLDPDEVRRREKFHEPKKFRQLQDRIQEIKQRGYRKQRPALLLDGNDIMKLLKISSGPDVGRHLDALREAQLEGAVNTRGQAMAFLKKRRGA